MIQQFFIWNAGLSAEWGQLLDIHAIRTVATKKKDTF